MQIMSSFNNNEPRRPDHQAENNELDLLPPGHQKTSSSPETFNHLPAKEPFELDDHPNKSNPFILPKCTSTLKYTQEMERDYRNDQFLDTICKRSKYDQSMDTIYIHSTKQIENRVAIHVPEEYYPSESVMGNYLNNDTFPPVTVTRTEEEVKKPRKYMKRTAPEVSGRWTDDAHNRLEEAVSKFEGERVNWNKVSKNYVKDRTPTQCKSHWQKFREALFVEKNINIDELKKSKRYLLKEREEISAYGLKDFALRGIRKPTLDIVLLTIQYLIKDIDSKLNTVPSI